MLSQRELIGRLVEKAEADERVRAVLLGGSLGRGDGDEFSDVDVMMVIAPEDHRAFMDGAEAWVGTLATVVHWHAPHPPLPLYNAYTDSWERLDLTVTVPTMVRGTQATLKPLIDRDGIHAGLPQAEPARAAPNAKKVEALAREFLRVLGLAPVVVGRRELAVAITGAGLLRQHGIAILVEAQGWNPQPGALSLSRVLPAEDLALVERLPLPQADMDSVIDANMAWAGAILPRARALCERAGAPWPDAFEQATRARLRATLGRDWG